MRRLIMALAFTVFCGSAALGQTLLDQQCEDDVCREQKKGYAWAKQNYITDAAKCSLRENASDDFLSGCEIYVDDSTSTVSGAEEEPPEEIGPADEEPETKTKPKR